MRHRKKSKHFNRDTGERKALFRSLLNSLILHEEIKTTQAKAKAVKRLVDRVIIKAKIGSLTNRRQLLAFLPSKKVVDKLIEEVAPRFKKVSSGFTRIILLGRRRGDDALMAKVELVKKKSRKRSESRKSRKGRESKESKE